LTVLPSTIPIPLVSLHRDVDVPPAAKMRYQKPLVQKSRCVFPAPTPVSMTPGRRLGWGHETATDNAAGRYRPSWEGAGVEVTGGAEGGVERAPQKTTSPGGGDGDPPVTAAAPPPRRAVVVHSDAEEEPSSAWREDGLGGGGHGQASSGGGRGGGPGAGGPRHGYSHHHGVDGRARTEEDDDEDTRYWEEEEDDHRYRDWQAPEERDAWRRGDGGGDSGGIQGAMQHGRRRQQQPARPQRQPGWRRRQ